MGGIFSSKYFTIFDGFMSIANILFYIYDGRMFVTNTNTIKKYFWYFRHMKAVTSVNNSDGFSLVVVNNTLLATNIFIPSQKVRREHFPPKKIIFLTKLIGIFDRLILLSQMF